MILYSPWGMLALLAVPLIILLYLLKQKHPDYTVSSLYLWQNAMQDLEANAPWQRLKKNILMLLQILAVIVLALILSSPFIKTGKKQGQTVIMVLDCSLSMQSKDSAPTRFEAAKGDMKNLVEALGPDTVYTLISSGREPVLIEHMCTDKNRILEEIKDLQVTDTIADTSSTSDIISSLKNQEPESQVYWFGDGDNPLSGDGTNYYTYNRNGANYAVSLLNYRKLSGSRGLTALSRISNFSFEKAEIDVSLYVDNIFFDARRISVEAGKSGSIYWQEVPEEALMLECRIDTGDILDKDNKFNIMVYPDKTRKILMVSEQNIYLEKVLSLLPNLELYKTTPEEAGELEGYDLYIFDGVMPEVLPGDGHYIFFNPPDNPYFLRTGEEEYPTVNSVSDTLFHDIGMDASFGAAKASIFELPDWADPVMKIYDNVTAFEGIQGKNKWMVFGFDLHATNLPVKPFFPIMVTRTVESLIPGSMEEVSSFFAGNVIDFPIDPESEEIWVIGPDGRKTILGPPFPAAAFSDTMISGEYTLGQSINGKTVNTSFFINPPSEMEFTGEVEILQDLEAGAEKAEKDTSGFWNLKYILLWLLLLILLGEWWVYTNGTTV